MRSALGAANRAERRSGGSRIAAARRERHTPAWSQLFSASQRALGALLILILASAGQAEVLVWECVLDESQVRNGPAHDGSTDSPGHAAARLELDTETGELSVEVEWRDLVGSLRKLHVHGPALPSRSNPRHAIELIGPPQPTPDQAGTRGRFEARFPLATVTHPGQRPVTPSDARRILESGLAYLNLHTSVFSGGELRGNLGKPQRGDARTEAKGETEAAPGGGSSP